VALEQPKHQQAIADHPRGVPALVELARFCAAGAWEDSGDVDAAGRLLLLVSQGDGCSLFS
jgi:hypothetical protein